ncbi:type IV pilin protein [Vibrio sonorensis]|uniref:type IV pilin protein n=1 Tax=Vibrio sonorensis TaxID=1004316 RepID=UPI0008D9B155|nr:pilin [Vibrio sonorensis]
MRFYITKQAAFSLIELMIVVVIIGVLSSIAIPQYQQYVARSEATSALTTLKALTTNIDIFISDTGQFPDQSSFSELGASSDMNPLGSITFPTSASSGHSVVFTFDQNSSTLNSSHAITYSKTALDSSWTCINATNTTLRGCAP